MPEKERKILSIKEKMKGLNRDTPLWLAYNDVLRGLEVTLHVSEESVCDGCEG